MKLFHVVTMMFGRVLIIESDRVWIQLCACIVSTMGLLEVLTNTHNLFSPGRNIEFRGKHGVAARAFDPALYPVSATHKPAHLSISRV